MELFLVSGVSGAGKTVFLKALEDIGYYCVDNLPIPLLVDFIKVMDETEEYKRVGLVIDVREKKFLDKAGAILEEIEKLENVRLKIVFLDAKDNVLERRFSETRRRHPVDIYNLEKSFAEERSLLSIFKDKADYVVDTTNYNNYDLRKRAEEFAEGRITKSRISIKITSFGYKFGLPNDVDIVFDMRFLPNPYYISDLKEKTGKDGGVKRFIKNSPASAEFIKMTRKLLFFMINNFEKEGKNFISIAFGCTGGRHRSVYMAEIFYKIFMRKYPDTHIFHRDLER
jgi:UPF0042 nucleotide-binding protein